MTTKTEFKCASCGQVLPSADTYHPYDACLRTEELRDENERLRAELAATDGPDRYGATNRELRSEVQRLRAELASDESISRSMWQRRCEEAQAENQRLRAVIEAAATEPSTHPDVAAALLRALG